MSDRRLTKSISGTARMVDLGIELGLIFIVVGVILGANQAQALPTVRLIFRVARLSRSNFILCQRRGTKCVLERDELWLDRHPALAFCLSMIFSENRIPLFRIML